MEPSISSLALLFKSHSPTQIISYIFAGLSFAGVVSVVWGILMRRRQAEANSFPKEMLSFMDKPPSRWQTTPSRLNHGVSTKVSKSMSILDLVEGLRMRDDKTISFACIGFGIMSFVIFFFLALGFYLVGRGTDSGWVWIGFMIFFVGTLARGMRSAYRQQKAEKY